MALKHNPRLAELGGMTEAGFNRVVAMVQWYDFLRPLQARMCIGERDRLAQNAWREWRASLPKTRNKRQRKADAKRTALHESAREQFEAIFPPVHCCSCDKKLELFDDYVKSGKRYCRACYGNQTPFQRLQQFAADTGVPVSFEIAELAGKKEW